MSRTVKVFCSRAEHAALAAAHRVVARYDGFLVLEVSPAKKASLGREYPLEDITRLFRIPIGRREEDPLRARPRAGRRRAQAKPRPGAHHHLVQFRGPIQRQWLGQIRRAGGELRVPYFHFVYVVRATPASLARIAKLDCVRWVGPLPHGARISSSLEAALAGDEPATTSPKKRVLSSTFVAEFFGPKDAKAAVRPVTRIGFRVLARVDRLLYVTPRAEDPNLPELVEALSAVHGVRVIRERPIRRKCNDVATRLMATNASTERLGLTGRGETVAVCDTGLDTGDKKTLHADLRGRVRWIKSYPITPDHDPLIHNPRGNDGASDLDSGHGTHVAGSILGNGVESQQLPGQTRPIRGLAHEARLVFQAVEQRVRWKSARDLRENGEYVLAGLPLDATTLFRDAYRHGARIHNDSWGGGAPGAYDAQCEQLDRFVWQHKDFCVLAAAGNDGRDADRDGKIDPRSVSSPATAKNCITVGASESERPAFSAETYGGWWPDDYPVDPPRHDPMADDGEQVAAFSSRGPTRDRRIKPDVVAPGTFILSTRSSELGAESHGWYPHSSRSYFFMGGTSMATPLAAGAVTLIRQYLRRDRGIPKPSAALLKAALILGAERLPGYGEPGAVCDHHQGHGRVNLDAVVAPKRPASVRFHDQSAGLHTGQVHAIELDLRSERTPLRIVLAYSDFPGLTLVNDLNLIVTAPNGRRRVGNATGGAVLELDAANNVEVVQVARPEPGRWLLEVVASSVPVGPQDFALAWRGDLGE